MLLGFDIGGTKCAVIIGRGRGEERPVIIDKVVLETNLPAYEMISALFTAAGELITKNGLSEDAITKIAITCGGPLNSKTGMILSPPNLPGWDHIPVTTLAERRFGKRAVLQNDANACAIAEWRYGAGKGTANMIFLTFGTGLGAGLILNGRLYSGSNDMAGEAGHIRLLETGPVGYGKAGSFEGFCSGGGIAQLAQIIARERLQMGKTTSYCKNMVDLPQITAKMVADAAQRGDTAALQVFQISGTYLGKGLSVLMDILDPEMIVIGGIFGRAQALLQSGMEETIAREVLPIIGQNCRIVPAALGEQIGDFAVMALAEMG